MIIYIKHISWGVIFMYAFRLHKHKRKILFLKNLQNNQN